MATQTAEAEVPVRPAKSKKLLLVLIILAVLVLVVGGGWIYLIKRQQAAALEEAEGGVTVEAKHEPPKPPTYLPLDNMVVNLADPGGERVAQVGVTLELSSNEATESVKAYLPSIRSEILLLISQRTAEELLSREGKEKLAAAIKSTASVHFGTPASPGKKNGHASGDESPIKGVLFSSFIVQ